MKFRTSFSGAGLKILCVAALLLAGCGNRRELKRANDDYQQALAVNDLRGQRLALLAMTRADDGISEYWIELARLELQLGMYGDAYGHFARAHELDRTAIGPLSMMTELAVINGRVDLAEEHLQKLIVLAPDDRAVAIARGFTALKQNDFATAQKNIDTLLINGPRDSVAGILQARLFIAQRKFPEAIAFLDGRLGKGGDDGVILRSLSAIHRYLGDWPAAAAADTKLWRAFPSAPLLAARALSSALQADDLPRANEITKRYLSEARTTDEAVDVLSAWVDHAPPSAIPEIADTAALPDPARIALANYYNRTDRPDRALALLGSTPRPLDQRANVDFNAVVAHALFLTGKTGPAKTILDRLVAIEPDDRLALSARALLLSKIGDHRNAVADAQRLVTAYDTLADQRVLLARIYGANRDFRWAERTLWDGYRDLPGNETLYRQLQRNLAGRGDQEGLVRLKKGQDEIRFSRLMKEMA